MQSQVHTPRKTQTHTDPPLPSGTCSRGHASYHVAQTQRPEHTAWPEEGWRMRACMEFHPDPEGILILSFYR